MSISPVQRALPPTTAVPAAAVQPEAPTTVLAVASPAETSSVTPVASAAPSAPAAPTGPPAAALATNAQTTAALAASSASFAPSTVALAEGLGVDFRTQSRGLEFWKTSWKPVGADRAVELANHHQALQAKIDGTNWLPVANLDQLRELIDQKKREGESAALTRTATSAADQVAEAATGCPFMAALKGPATQPHVSLLSLARAGERNINDPLGLVEELHAKYGPSFSADIPTKGHFVFDARPEVLKQALANTDNGDHSFSKCPLVGHGAAFLIGDSNIFLSGGQDWSVVHEALKGKLSKANVQNDAMVGRLQGIFNDSLNELKAQVAKSPNGEADVDIRTAMQRPVLDVAMQVLLGTELSRDDLTKLQHAFTTQTKYLTKETINPTNTSISKLPGEGELADAYKTLSDTADKVIRERRASGNLGDDMLGGLLQVKDPDTGEGLSDERLRHEVISIMEAGHETTGSLMSWSLLMLAKHPDEYKKLQDNVDQAVGQREATMADLANIPQADHVMKEALRMYPPFYMFMRTANTDVSVDSPEGGKMVIPKGTTLVSNLYTSSHDESTWGVKATGYAANEFHPERFDHSQLPAAVMNFGGGKHGCLGMMLGQLETQLMLTKVAQEFDISADPGKPATVTSDLSLHPGDAMVHLKLRQPPAAPPSDR